MKHKYLLAAFLAGALGQQAQAQTTAWRPFRPGFVYGFTQNPGTVSTYSIRTLRVDSAYATAAGDSVYTFNRLLRAPSPSSSYAVKSRNNLFGARLRWQPGTSNYYLEANAEAATGQATPVALLLRPRAAVGSTWTASTTPALTATLSSRVVSPTSATDSIATITLSNGQQFIFSRANGLTQGPQWLMLSASATTLATQWRQFSTPQPGLGVYDPRTLFSMNVGDEMGYIAEVPYLWGSLLCKSGYRLRRVSSRVVTADSLIISYREQRLITTYSTPNCGGQPGTVLSPVQTGRWAFSLRTGASPQFPFLALLTGEYRPYLPASGLGGLLVGNSYTLDFPGTACLNYGSQLAFLAMYPMSNNANQYMGGIDGLAINESYDVGAKMGPYYFQDAYNNKLSYFRKAGVACGSPINFSTLLPSRAAEAAAAATLHPNPAAEAATLTLAAPTRPGTVLTLTDALGRRVWSREVAAGQTSLPIALGGQPAGLYLVQLAAPGAAPLTWKLNH
ncbi:MAG TPA: hypothetical protein VFO93_11795 [Hymenobacter sp.]|uniref:hypothetical protein n=1 Tax=Hymenobacter sp. TaxID=1898978 RepID=UPI002D7FAEAC|nr:hypothetical protein [Hymenobacter sp.]HET9504217.1 hypothetical protein [Hymenobacter sp.]